VRSIGSESVSEAATYKYYSSMQTPQDRELLGRNTSGPFSPERLEVQYQSLCETLDRQATDGWHLAHIARFLWQCPAEPPGIAAYLLDLAPALHKKAEAFDPVGWHPAELRRLANALQLHRATHSDLDTLFGEAETHVRIGAAQLYIYAGALDAAVSVLPDAVCGTPLREENLDATMSPRERWESWANAMGAECVPVIEAIDAAWSASAASGAAPVVEQGRTQRQASRGVAVGGVLDVRVDVLSRRGNGVTVEGYRSGLLTLAQSRLDAPVAAAQSLLHDNGRAPTTRDWTGRICLLGSEGQAAGDSIQLAVALQVRAALQQARYMRVQDTPRESTLLTGGVAADGTVQAVHPDTLPLKVQTAFFSPVRYLVVPASQADDATAACERLYDAFPHGNLTVLGLDCLQDAYHDRRITERTEVGRVRYAARRAWGYRTALASSLVIVFLLTALAWTWLGPIDQDPASVSFEGKHMVLANANGHVVERIDVGEQVVRSHEQGRHEAYALHDVTGDGHNDICWTTDSEDASATQFLRCKAAGASKPLWSLPLTFEVNAYFPHKPEVVGSRFTARILRAGDFDQDGAPELLLSANHTPYFPSLLLRLDAQTGTEEARYLHPGFIKDIKPFDLTGDGQPEIVGCATSNALGSAVAFALDPRAMHGHAPTQGNYQIDGLPKASEIAYVRTPPTLVHQSHSLQRNSCLQVRTFPDENRFLVEVADGHPRSEDETQQSWINVHFNTRFVPQTVGTSDHYDRLSKQLYAEGRIAQRPDDAYFQDYLQRLRYWNGQGWQAEPVVNRIAK
jgi:hypothetical protein